MNKKIEIDPQVLADFSRRSILGTGMGLGAIAAAELLGGGAVQAKGSGGSPGDAGPDMGKLTTGQFPARAKRVIDIHMKGAVSQVDTFDYKPTVIKMHGTEIPPSVKGKGKISSMSNAQSSFPVMGPIAPFKQYGQSGRWVSDLMPHIGAISDDLTFIHSIWTPQVNHDPADVLMHTGFQLAGRPSGGAWVNYALGTDNSNLPAFVVMRSQFQSAGVGATQATWSAGFLPSNHQGVEFRSGNQPVLYVSNPDGVSRQERRGQMDVIDQLSQYQYQTTGDPEILSKIAQYEMAYRMQDSVPEVTDLSDEPEYILNMYGPQVHVPGTFARNCLLTRRLIERGVKYVNLIQVGWDHHNGIARRHPSDCWAVDQPSAALVQDLKQRGLLDDTLVTFKGEFGRTVYAQGGIQPNSGRDHQRRQLHHVDGRRRHQAGHQLRQDRRLQLQRRRESGRSARSERDDALPAGHRPQAAHLPLPRPRLPSDGHRGQGGPGRPGLGMG
ncbi:MAG: DUF1501 domain-containing protein [Caulobacteraceae bacterium]